MAGACIQARDQDVQIVSSGDPSGTVIFAVTLEVLFPEGPGGR